MRESERIDPLEETDRIADRLIDLARASQRGGHREQAILRALAPLLDTVYPGAPRPLAAAVKGPDPRERTKIPFLLKSLDADEVAELLGVSKRFFVDRLQFHPLFPKQATPAEHRPRWIAGEVVDWRIDARPKLKRKTVRVKRDAPAQT